MPKKQPSRKPSGAAASERVRVIYKGRVQGVGFRYTAERIGHEIGVTGWVRNLPDGDVEMVAEGKRDKLEALLDRIKGSEVGRHITKSLATWGAAQNEFKDFRIEFVY